MEQVSQFIINHWALCLALVVVLGLTFINERMEQKQKGKALTPEEAIKEINNDAVVIDLREDALFKSGHIIDAINASTADFENNKLDKYKDKPLILVCQRGTQASGLAAQLRAKGFIKPMILAGGMTAWSNASLPIVKGK